MGQERLGPSYFFIIISVRPSKQPLMVLTFLKVYMELGSYFLFLQEQIKDIIITITPPSYGNPTLPPVVYVQFSSVGACMVWGGDFFSSFWDRIWGE